MPQGKMKVKAKLPDSVKLKKKVKGPAISKRKNAPSAPSKAKNLQVQKLKEMITKKVNASTEAELVAVALDGKKSLITKKDTKPK